MARYLGDWGAGLLVELTYTPVTGDHTSIKEFILDKLLLARLRNRKRVEHCHLAWPASGSEVDAGKPTRHGCC